ncbi:MAG: hypothetical protein PHT88_03435 [Candidatus Moranbacteria bacterium]|nr:hypothetical protein [Candidatus Moranbacteria bacterium]
MHQSIRTSIQKLFSLQVGFFLILALPASTNYKLKDFGIGSGGSSTAASANYKADVISGETDNGNLTGTTYNLGTGLAFTNQADVPAAPTFTNPSNYYNKLKIVLDASSNATDTKFAIAISPDDFVTTYYVQSDAAIGMTLGSEDYQTSTGWGSASGTIIIGLTPNTTYKAKVKAMQGDFTETGYGPIATASTINPTMTFDIDVSATDTDTSPPFTINLGDLIASTITDGPQKIWVDFSTNGELGGRVYVVAQNAGLQSVAASYKINAVTGNLSALPQGFGAQGSSVANGLSIATLYDLSGDNVGVTDTNIREIFSSTSPTTGGRGSFLLKAKSAATTPSASDYAETLTVIASASF